MMEEQERQRTRAIDNLKRALDEVAGRVQIQADVSVLVNPEGVDVKIYDELKNELLDIEKVVCTRPLTINYLKQLQNDIQALRVGMPFHQQSQITHAHEEANRPSFKRSIENAITSLIAPFERLKFNSLFFKRLNYISNHTVILGANGSGKSSLANYVKTYLLDGGVVIPAQRFLKIDSFNAMPNPAKTKVELYDSQKQDKTLKNAQSYSYVQNEFKTVLQHLIAENITVGNTYFNEARELGKQGKDKPDPPDSLLIQTFEIWNSLIDHRQLVIPDGVNIKVIVPDTDEEPYDAIKMSDGEKVLLYMIGQVLLAPKDGFIIIDEPEMFLHKSILKKLWNRLQEVRDDCIFVYLTHDVDFAISRVDAIKVWSKIFEPPTYWEIEQIETKDIPEPLLLELLGSRKEILFCESEKGKLDEAVYELLFPNHTIKPVGGCKAVADYTKAYNLLPSVYSKACGIVDADHRQEEELAKLAKSGVYSISVSEIENLLLDEYLLRSVAKQLLSEKEDSVVDTIKHKIIEKLSSEKELQISNYVSARVNFLFETNRMKQANNQSDLQTNLSEFNAQLKIDDWYNERGTFLGSIIENQDYEAALGAYNNKGLIQIANQVLGIKVYKELAVKLLSTDAELRNKLLRHFPDQLAT